MRLRLRDGETRLDMLIGRRQIDAARPEIDALRQRTGHGDDWTSSVQRFEQLASLDGELPAVLLLERGGAIYAAVLLNLRRKLGMPVGLVRSGNRDGQGGVIAPGHEHVAVMETAARALLKIPLVHTAVMQTVVDWTDPAESLPAAGLNGHWHLRDMGIRLDLSAGPDATLAQLGYKMRRNLRYYRRRAEADFGVRFHADLTPAERGEAVSALYDKGMYPNRAQRAQRQEAALLSTPGGFAMGLQAADGGWLSYLAGWRTAQGTFVDWQLNHDQAGSASISTAMRSYLLDHEMARNSPAITFVGGTAPLWRRLCERRICGHLLATRTGLAGRLATWLTFVVSPEGEVAALHGRGTPRDRIAA